MSEESEFKPLTGKEKTIDDLDRYFFFGEMEMYPELHADFLKQETRNVTINILIKKIQQQSGLVIRLSDIDISTINSLPDAPSFKELVDGFNRITFGPQGSRDLDLPTD